MFKLVSKFQPAGDQISAIKQLIKNLNNQEKFQILLGVTGSGKTFTMANVIAQTGKPAIIFAPNKTLAAQLYNEFKTFFPKNAVEYFVSFYDYYQPEAYVPQRDVFIDKDSAINEQIEQMRLACTKSLMERRDVIIIASVSAIYGLGEPENYKETVLKVRVGDKISQKKIIQHLIYLRYKRQESDFFRGQFRVRGDYLDIFPFEHNDLAVRIEFSDEENEKIENIKYFDYLTGKIFENLDFFTFYPGNHYVSPRERVLTTIEKIKKELNCRVTELLKENKLVEAQRLEQRTRFDLEMITEIGHCKGIENYSLYLSNRKTGDPPYTLIDYLHEDTLMFLDESHQMVGQLKAMFNGDFQRKTTLVNYGFRLPSALDNRPLKFEEFEKRMKQTIFVSATPSDYEFEKSKIIVEQLVRPTGLIDPEIEIKPIETQVDDVFHEIYLRVQKNERVLITTLTKKMSEQLSDYLFENGVKVRYLHSDIDAIERMEIIRDLRLGVFDVLIGINLLREGLDIPEVSLVAILDADKEGFLRSERSLIQTIGRVARNINGKAILYADKITGSMQRAINETNRRRNKQIQFNLENNIQPKSVISPIKDFVNEIKNEENKGILENKNKVKSENLKKFKSEKQIEKEIQKLEKEMKIKAKKLDFENAAKIRDQIKILKTQILES